VSLASFLTFIARALNEAEIPFMLTGSLAAAFYGAPRATQDIDLIIESQPEKLRRFVADLIAAGLYVDLESALEALRTRSQFNAIEPTTGWKADLIFQKARPFSATEFGRRQEQELFGIEIALTTLEDLILAKLEWSELSDSELQRRDIRNLIEIAGDSIDQSYLDRWIDALELRHAWERATRAD